MGKALSWLVGGAFAISTFSCGGNKLEAEDTQQQLFTADKTTESVQHYKQRMAFSNNEAKAFCDEGIALFEKGDNASAKRLLLRALELEPNNAIVLTNLGHLSYAERNFADAVAYYNRSHIIYDPENLDPGVHLGRSYYLNGEYGKCIIISRFAAAHAKDEKSYYLSNYNLAKALIKTGECDQARLSFKEIKPATMMFSDLKSRIHVLEHELENCANR